MAALEPDEVDYYLNLCAACMQVGFFKPLMDNSDHISGDRHI